MFINLSVDWNIFSLAYIFCCKFKRDEICTAGGAYAAVAVGEGRVGVNNKRAAERSKCNTIKRELEKADLQQVWKYRSATERNNVREKYNGRLSAIWFSRIPW